MRNWRVPSKSSIEELNRRASAKVTDTMASPALFINGHGPSAPAPPSNTQPATSGQELPRLLVLYGSETGTAQDVAEYVQQLAFARRLVDTQVIAMDAFPVAQLLPQCDMVVFVTSTTGDGEAPENMRAAWRSLLRKNLSAEWLRGVQVAVFGLGDSSYAKYNAVARKLQARLVQLGATEIVERGLGDDQHAFGYFGALNPWLTKLWDAVLAKYPVPAGFKIDDSPRPIEPQYQVVFHDNEADSAIVNAAWSFDPREDKSRFYAAPKTAINADQGIYFAPVVVNTRLTAQDWTQDVRHLEFGISNANNGGSVPYSAGAIADVYPENTWGVDEMLGYVASEASVADTETSNLGDQVISIKSADGSPQFDLPSPTTVRDVFTKYLDILGTPRRSFFAKLSLFAANEEEKEKLEELASPEGVDLLYDYCIREKKTYSEVLLDFPSAKVPLAILLQLIPVLRPRSYSISSSPLLHPGRVSIKLEISFNLSKALSDNYYINSTLSLPLGALDRGDRGFPDALQAPSLGNLLSLLSVSLSTEFAEFAVEVRAHVAQDGALQPSESRERHAAYRPRHGPCSDARDRPGAQGAASNCGPNWPDVPILWLAPRAKGEPPYSTMFNSVVLYKM